MRMSGRLASVLGAAGGWLAAMTGTPVSAEPVISNCNLRGDMRPVFSPDRQKVAVLSSCQNLQPWPGLDIGVAPLRHEAKFQAHNIAREDAVLGRFTSNDTITWMSSGTPRADGAGQRSTSTLSIYERDLKTDKDRLVVSLEEPFTIRLMRYMDGGDCDLVGVDESPDFNRAHRYYLLAGAALTPATAALPAGRAAPLYWDSSANGFVFRVNPNAPPTGLHPKPEVFVRVGCNGKAVALKADPRLEEMKWPAYAPRAPQVAATFFPQRGVPQSQFGLIDTAETLRTGRLQVTWWDQTWPPYELTPDQALISSKGKYVGIEFGSVFYAMRTQDHAPVFKHVRSDRMAWAKPAFTPDETGYLLILGDRLELYPIEGQETPAPVVDGQMAMVTFAGARNQTFRLLDGPTCASSRDGKLIAAFPGGLETVTREAEPMPFAAGKPIYVLFGADPALHAPGTAPNFCAGVMRLTPQAGRRYLVYADYKDFACTVTAQDLATRKTAPSVRQYHGNFGRCMAER